MSPDSRGQGPSNGPSGGPDNPGTPVPSLGTASAPIKHPILPGQDYMLCQKTETLEEAVARATLAAKEIEKKTGKPVKVVVDPKTHTITIILAIEFNFFTPRTRYWGWGSNKGALTVDEAFAMGERIADSMEKQFDKYVNDGNHIGVLLPGDDEPYKLKLDVDYEMELEWQSGKDPTRHQIALRSGNGIAQASPGNSNPVLNKAELGMDSAAETGGEFHEYTKAGIKRDESTWLHEAFHLLGIGAEGYNNEGWVTLTNGKKVNWLDTIMGRPPSDGCPHPTIVPTSLIKEIIQYRMPKGTNAKVTSPYQK